MNQENKDLVYGIIVLVLLFIPMIYLFFSEVYHLNNGYWIYYSISFRDFKIKAYRFYYERNPIPSSNDNLLFFLYNWILFYMQFLVYLTVLLQFILIPLLIILIIKLYSFKELRD